jgi:hypothetical protein
MKAKILAFFIISLMALTSSAQTPEERKLAEERNMKMLEEMGLPAFNSGIKIVPRAMLGTPEKVAKKGAEEEKQRKSLGYVKKNTSRPMELLSLRKNAPIYLKTYAKNTNDESTYLRKNIKDLKLAFKFKGVPHRNSLLAGSNVTLIGVAPQGGFHEESGGWSGAAQFFDVKNIGSCSYGVMNVKASGTSALLAQEDVVYDINNKATIILVEGNEKSGFLYKVEWYDDENFHELECANKSYSSEINSSVIKLAKAIDNG